MDEIKNWFCGFEKGIARLTARQREAFFCECGKNCVQNGVLGLYRQLYTEVGGNMDLFFSKLNEWEGVRSEIVREGEMYHLYFTSCVCPLHNSGYVNTPLLCECSRQSVRYTMQALWKGKQFEVALCSSVLGGATECKLSIKVAEEKEMA